MQDEFTWLRLPAAMSSLAPFHEFAREGAERAGFSEEQLHKLDLLLEELLVNVFHYAYPPGEAGEAALGYAFLATGGLRFQIRDGGREFNPLDKEDPDLNLPSEERPIGGLGIYLVKAMADSIRYAREDGANVVWFELSGRATAGRRSAHGGCSDDCGPGRDGGRS